MAYKPGRKLRIMVLVDAELIPPENPKEQSEADQLAQKNEYDIITTLKKLGHDVHVVGLATDIGVIRQAIEEFNPHCAFNLLAEFQGHSLFEPHIVSYLELRQIAYTGCNPRGLMIAHDKVLTKKILSYHRVKVPEFALFEPGRKIKRPARLAFPLFVKSAIEEGSVGISQASLVRNDESLAERVELIHRQTKGTAIAEQFVEGREIYVAMMGNHRVRAFPAWELVMKNLPDGAPVIATSRAKWNRKYQNKVGLVTEAAKLTPELASAIERLSKRIYKILDLSGYARLDYRVTDDGKIYLLEANPNPDISSDEDFAESARYEKLSYEELVQKLINLGMSYRPFRL